MYSPVQGNVIKQSHVLMYIIITKCLLYIFSRESIARISNGNSVCLSVCPSLGVCHVPIPILGPCLAFVLSHFRGSKVADTDTTDLQLLLSAAHWTHSATDLPVHCLISSVQRLRGLPRPLFLAILPCRTRVLRFSARTT